MDLRTLHIIDVDAHITEPHDLWTRNAPKGFEDRVPRVVAVDGTDQWVVDGVPIGRAMGASVIKPDGVKHPGFDFITWGADDIAAASYDMTARVEVMDELGLYAQILYPNTAGFGAQKFGEVEDPELRRLCATLYNDAMVEIQEASGGRLLPMALMPWWDVDASIAEVGRAAANGLRGVNMCTDPQHRGLPDLGERAWDPFWAACEEHGMPVNFHIGASDTSLTWFGTSPWPSQDDERKLAIGSAMMYLSNARILANLVFSGVFERFPSVQFVSVESGIGWIPFFLESLDYQLYESAPSAVDQLSMKPSEYFRRQVHGCFWFEGYALAPVIEALGRDRILFETDYPHPTCLYPDPLPRVAEAVAGLDDTTVQMIMQDNAAALYRIPLPVSV
ncbi:MAG: amidohydrolase [Actinobacteria bacterium]|nr:amidohydrolase [Actinomycetota bacterium]